MLIGGAELEVGEAGVEDVAIEGAAVCGFHGCVDRLVAAGAQGADVGEQEGHFRGCHFEGGHARGGNSRSNEGCEFLIVPIEGPLDDAGAELASVAVASVAGCAVAFKLFLTGVRSLRRGNHRQDKGGEQS